jgi:hypothetical protein
VIFTNVLSAKMASTIAAATIAAGGTAAAATGKLPTPVQAAVAHAADNVGVTLPRPPAASPTRPSELSVPASHWPVPPGRSGARDGDDRDDDQGQRAAPVETTGNASGHEQENADANTRNDDAHPQDSTTEHSEDAEHSEAAEHSEGAEQHRTGPGRPTGATQEDHRSGTASVRFQ